MAFRPVQDLAGLLPVIHLLKGDVLHRRSRHDHSVKFPGPYLIQGSIKFIKVAGRRVHRHMAFYIHKGHIHLNGRIGQGTQKLQLCILLNGHVIQYQDLKGADILMHRPLFVHHKYIFILQNAKRRQIALCSNRHIYILLSALTDADSNAVY